MKSRRLSKLVWRKEYEQFRERLLAARIAARLTQREAAAKIGRSHSFVAKSEAGERRVDLVELVQFARAYRKPLNWFAPFLKR